MHHAARRAVQTVGLSPSAYYPIARLAQRAARGILRSFRLLTHLTQRKTMTLACNVGGTDKLIRITLGVALVALGLLVDLGVTWSIVAYAVAVILLLTALLNYCPLNTLFGIDTCVEEPA